MDDETDELVGFLIELKRRLKPVTKTGSQR